MYKRFIPIAALMSIGVLTTSCDKNELEEAATESAAVVENAASGNIIIEETFEGSDPTSTFHGVEFGTTHAFSVDSNPVFDGAKVGRLELRDSDPLESGGTRAEMTVIKDVEEGNQKEMWYSFAVYLPASDFGFDTEEEIITQWHQSGGSPPRNLMVEKDKWRFDVTNNTDTKTKYDLGPVAKNTWNQFTFHIIQSNGSDGLVEIWHNGTKVVTHQGGNMYNVENLPKWKVGIYKWEWNGSATTDVSKRVLYFDNIRVGNANATLAEMTAGGVVSDVIPTVDVIPTGEETPTGDEAPADEEAPTGPIGGGVEGVPLPAGITLTYVNAQIDKDVKVLTNGSSLSLSEIGTPKVNIRADFQTQVGSTKFELSGAKNYTYIDNNQPHALFGDDGAGNYYYGSYLPEGNYTMTVTPYSGSKGTGTAGTPVKVSFTITK